MIEALIACYLFLGLVVAFGIHPVLGHNFVVTVFLWPWPVAAEVVRSITGKYPKWTPPL